MYAYACINVCKQNSDKTFISLFKTLVFLLSQAKSVHELIKILLTSD